MPSEVSDSLRQTVSERANHCCEYCLFPQSMALHKHEIVQPLTAEARVTIQILSINSEERVRERQRLLEAGLYGNDIRGKI